MTEPEGNLILNFRIFRTNEPELTAEIVENLCDYPRPARSASPRSTSAAMSSDGPSAENPVPYENRSPETRKSETGRMREILPPHERIIVRNNTARGRRYQNAMRKPRRAA